MNRQERARVIASLTHEEIRQLRDRASDAATTDAPRDAELRFARSLFGASDDDDQDVDGEDQDQDDDDDDDERAAQKHFVATLFADDDQDPIIAGLVAGKTVGRTTPPRPDDVPRNEFRFS